MGYAFTIEKFYKSSKHNTQLFKVINVQRVSNVQNDNPKTTLVYTDFVQSIDNMLKHVEKNSSYCKRNYDAATVNWMINECEKNDVKFGYRGTRSAKFTIVMQKIKSVTFHGMLLETSMIEKIGDVHMRIIRDSMNGTNRHGMKQIVLEPFEMNLNETVLGCGCFFHKEMSSMPHIIITNDKQQESRPQPVCSDPSNCSCSAVRNSECEHGFDRYACVYCYPDVKVESAFRPSHPDTFYVENC